MCLQVNLVDLLCRGCFFLSWVLWWGFFPHLAGLWFGGLWRRLFRFFGSEVVLRDCLWRRIVCRVRALACSHCACSCLICDYSSNFSSLNFTEPTSWTHTILYHSYFRAAIIEYVYLTGLFISVGSAVSKCAMIPQTFVTFIVIVKRQVWICLYPSGTDYLTLFFILFPAKHHTA